MKVRKIIASILLATVIFFGTTWLASPLCSGALPDTFIEGTDSQIFLGFVPLYAVSVLATFLYDLISFATYRLNIEPNYDEVYIYPGENPPAGTLPLSRRQKFVLGYPVFMIVVAVFSWSWTKVVYCA